MDSVQRESFKLFLGVVTFFVAIGVCHNAESSTTATRFFGGIIFGVLIPVLLEGAWNMRLSNARDWMDAACGLLCLALGLMLGAGLFIGAIYGSHPEVIYLFMGGVLFYLHMIRLPIKQIIE